MSVTPPLSPAALKGEFLPKTFFYLLKYFPGPMKTRTVVVFHIGPLLTFPLSPSVAYNGSHGVYLFSALKIRSKVIISVCT